MTGRPPRLLYVPNEHGEITQLGFRRPLADLLRVGLLGDVSVFSLEQRISRGGDAEQHRRDLVARVAEFRPDVVLMQHLGATGLRARHFRAMRAAAEFALIYSEADPYRSPWHPLPAAAVAAGREAEVVFTSGDSGFAREFRRAGARDVRWEPSTVELDRFPASPIDDSAERELDVVVVANRNRPRIRPLPDWRARIEFVSLLERRFGSRFAVYGNGWEGPSARGPIPYARQHEAVRSAWISANWDHFAGESRYFSNRLPIALTAGSLHATTRHPGFDKLFGAEAEEFLILGTSPRELVDRIEQKLGSTAPDDRRRAGRAAQSFAVARLRQDDQLVRFLNAETPRIDVARAAACWDLATPPLEEG